LERSWGFLAGRPDKPCSGAARFEPANSGVAPLWSTASMVAICSPARSGADPSASAMVGAGPWPPPVTRDTWTSGAPPPQISKDCKRRGAAPYSAACGALGVDSESDDFPRYRRLCKESRGGRSHRKAGRRTPVAPPIFSGGWLGGVRISATRRRPSRWVPREVGPSAGPLG
jgi:hypothetical protein